MRFVPIKHIEQQAVLALHRVHQGFVKARPAQANPIRGLLAAFGRILLQDMAHLAKWEPEWIEPASHA
jgi:transposase